MDFDHIMNVIEETDMDNLYSDIPLALFMIKILSTKVKFHSISGPTEEGFIKYMESDKPIKLRYYLQVTIKDEINSEYDKKVEEMKNEIKKVDTMFKKDPRVAGMTNPNYEDRMYIYNKYFRDYLTDDIIIEETQKLNKLYKLNVNIIEMINKWKYDYEQYGCNTDINRSTGYIGVIDSIISAYYYLVINSMNREYHYLNDRGLYINRYEKCMDQIQKILNKFNTKQSVEDLLYSNKDVVTIGLSP